MLIYFTIYIWFLGNVVFTTTEMASRGLLNLSQPIRTSHVPLRAKKKMKSKQLSKNTKVSRSLTKGN